jgi:hypothetical protein
LNYLNFNKVWLLTCSILEFLEDGHKLEPLPEICFNALWIWPEGLAAESGSAGALVSPRRNSFAYLRPAGLDYKVFGNEQEKAYNTPDKRQHRNVAAKCNVVEKDASVFIFGDFPLVFKRNIFPLLVSQGGMKKETDHKTAQFQNKDRGETGPCGEKQFPIGGRRQGYNLVYERK